MSVPQQPSRSGPAYRNSTFDNFNVAAERQTGRYGDKPLLTWYDDHRDERVELSYRTFDNWVAKTANLLVDELGAEPGDRVGVGLAGHWQAPIVLAACWRAGVRVVVLDPAAPGPPAGRLLAAFVREEHLAAAGPALAGAQLVSLPAGVLGRRGRDLGRALNFPEIVPSMGDVFDGGLDPGGELLVTGAGTATMAGLLERAAALAGRTGLTDADRMLSAVPLLTPAGAAAGLLAPFTRGAGVVLAAGFDPARFWKRAADERVAVAVLEPAQAAGLLDAGPPPPDLDRSRLRVAACQGAGEAVAARFQTTFEVPLLDD